MHGTGGPVGGLTHVEQCDAALRSQHSSALGDHCREVDEVAQREATGDRVDRAVGEREVHCVGARRGVRRCWRPPTCLRRSRPRSGDGRRVAACGKGRPSRTRGRSPARRARSPGAASRSAGASARPPVAERRQPIQEVVTRSDPVEHLLDGSRLLLSRTGSRSGAVLITSAIQLRAGAASALSRRRARAPRRPTPGVPARRGAEQPRRK